MKIVIIGGVAAGTSAAAKASRTGGDHEIVLLERDQDISYAGCGLPYYISGVVPSRDKLIANYPEEFSERYDVDVRTGHEVTEIDAENKTVKYTDLARDLCSGEDYDRLIIATGASPFLPPIEGIENDNVLTLRTVKDADQLKRAASDLKHDRVCIVGAGLVGLEMAEAFSELDMEVTVIEQREHVLPMLPAELAEELEEHLISQGVNLVLDDGVSEFAGEGEVESVITSSGRTIPTDLVLVSVGIKPNSRLAEEAGVSPGAAGAIGVNDKMETDTEAIYACGDCAETTNLITGEKAWVPLGSTANKQGRAAGANAAGGDERHRGVLKTGITKVFDYTAAATGLKEEEATEAGFDPAVITVNVPNHAGYFPGYKHFTLRGVFDTGSGRILGAAAVGEDGVNKRIDVLAAAIYSEQTAEDLFQMDLGYAPPYSTPKDPVAVLGMVAGKKL